MSEQIKDKILSHLKSEQYRPQRPRKLAKALNLNEEQHYPAARGEIMSSTNGHEFSRRN